MPNKDRPLVDRHAPKNGVGWLVKDQKQLLESDVFVLRIRPAMRNLTAITTIATASMLILLPTQAKQFCRPWGVLITAGEESIELRKSGSALFKSDNGFSLATWELGVKSTDYQAVLVTAPWMLGGEIIEFSVDHDNVRCLFN